MARREIVWEMWVSILGEYTCARCASLHGQVFRKGEGPQPPLHDRCRCHRRLSHVEVIEEPDVPMLPPIPLPGDDDEEDEDKGR